MRIEEARHRLERDLDEYLAALIQEKQYAPNTIAAYRNDLRQFLDYVAEVDGAPDGEWALLPDSRLTEYAQRLTDARRRAPDGHERSAATSTVARKIAALKSFFRYLARRGKVVSDPAQALDAPKVAKRRPRTLSSAEVERLLAAPGNANQPKALRDRALLELLYATGMRVSELVALNLADVDEEGKQVVVRSDRGDKVRHIPVDDRALQALQNYLKHGRPALVKNATDHPALFLNLRGRVLTRQGMWLIIKEYAGQAGIPFDVTPHTLRHSFAAHMLETHKASLDEVRHFLGHASASTTQIYSQRAAEQNPVPAEG